MPCSFPLFFPSTTLQLLSSCSCRLQLLLYIYIYMSTPFLRTHIHHHHLNRIQLIRSPSEANTLKHKWIIFMARKKATSLTARAWNLVRLALLWPRRHGVFMKRSFISGLFPDHLNRLPSVAAEREFSFDETPLFQFKLHKSSGSMRFKYLPCISLVADDVEDGRNVYRSYTPRKDDDGGDVGRSSLHGWEGQEVEVDQCWREEEEIDVKAEEFIENFYEQMRLQRQVSYTEYNEMLLRGSG